MTGGSLSLTESRGLGQDVININPQITFFKKVYKRHTNFGIETVRQTNINRVINFNTTSEIIIEKKGSLISDMHLEFTLPPAVGDGGVENDNVTAITPIYAGEGCVDNFKGYARWVNSVGFAIINEIKFKFGTNVVDTHTGLWFDVWNELTDPNRKEWGLIGKYDDDERLGESDFNYSRYYLPLKFFFNRNPGLALPIFLLNDNEVRIEISLNPLASLLLYNRQDAPAAAPTINDKNVQDVKFYTTYIFLEKTEESRIENSLPSEYLIETLDIHKNINSTLVSNLLFENPTKEFIWVFRHPDRIKEGSATNIPEESPSFANLTKPNDRLNYSRHGTNDSLRYGTFDPFSTLRITISNKDRFDASDATYFRNIQPYQYHSNKPGGINNNHKKKYIYVYSFALNPEDYQPSGSFNFSLGEDNTAFVFTGPNTVGNIKGISEYDLTIFSVRYEFLTITMGRADVARVPIQTVFQEAQSEVMGTKNKIIESQNKAVEQEVQRRYAVEVPYLKQKSIGKKKWSGLQGEHFLQQKYDDQDKDYQTKKKDIF